MAGKYLLSICLFLCCTSCSFGSAKYCQFQEETKTLGCAVKNLESGLSSLYHDQLLRANNLRIFCSPETSIFTAATLKNGHFGNLPFLQNLELKFCNIKRVQSMAFQGLRSLKSLSIQSFNQEWTSVTMELEKDSLKNMEHLEHLNLSSNNLWVLPEDLFCDLSQLKVVNLSRNHLLQVSDIEQSCPIASVEQLDVSNNLIKEMKAVNNWTKLKWLSLSNNRLNLLEEDALRNVTSLQDLDLSSNQLSAIPDEFFNQTMNLKKLSLQNNSLTLLPPGLFKNLEHLKVLNLSRNSLTSHLMNGAKTFQGLKHLQVLDLSFNQITKLETEVYQSLKELKILKLDFNHIVTLSSNVFERMTNLQILTLSHNQMTNVQMESLNALKNLETLSLDHNKLSSVHFINEEYSPDIKLQDLALNNNNLKEVPSFIQGCKNLRTLDLGENGITDVEHFENLNHLYGLRLSGNELTFIGNSSFSALKSIHILNLAENQISSIEVGALNQLSELRALRLDSNKLQDINGIVSSLRSLQWLNISSNGFAWFDYAFIPNSLEWLDLSNNSVEQLGNYYNLEHFQLQTLDVSLNKMKKVDQTFFLKSLEKINLSQNRISQVTPFTFADLTHLKTLDLRKNQLSTLLEDALRIRNAKGQYDIHLAENPLTCDCNLQWMKHSSKITDLADVGCQIPTTKEVTNLVSVSDSDFLCPYQTHCSNSCMCCDFYACDCRFQCPQGCECFHDKKWNKNIVQCSNRDHQHVPLLIPLDATEVTLDGNMLRHLDTQSFLGRGNIKRLYLNNSNILSLSNHTFAGLDNLENLHLENNQLTEIHGTEFATLTSLQELHLSNNDLFYIAEKAFESLQNLRTLTLDGNLLMNFPAWTLLNNPFLTGLNLARNSWSCDCDFIKPFNFFLEKKSLIIRDYEDIQCLSDNIISENVRLKCPAGYHQSEQKSTSAAGGEKSSGEKASDYGPYLIALLTVAGLVLALCFLVIVVFRKPIKEWMYSKSNEVYESRSSCSVSSRTLVHANDTQKLFDIYISYSLKESDFVEKKLSSTLSSSNYKLCLQQRDFPRHLSIPDAISVATESSARILVILTKHYIQTEWQRVKKPMMTSLNGNEMQKLIFILLENLNDQDLVLNPELHCLLQNCQIVAYDSSESLLELQQSLPETAFATFQRNINTRNQVNSRLFMPLPSPPKMQPHAALPNFAVVTAPALYHPNTYNNSITEHQHIYHTLHEAQNKHLQSLEISQPSSPVLYHHCHTYSASSGTQLIPSQNKKQDEEYIV